MLSAATPRKRLGRNISPFSIIKTRSLPTTFTPRLPAAINRHGSRRLVISGWLGQRPFGWDPRTNRRLVHSAQEGGLRRGSSQLFRLYPGSGIFRSKSHSTHASGRLAGRNGRASTMTLSRPNFAPADPECLLRSICETYSEHLSSEIAPIAEIGRTLTVARRPMPSRQRAFTHSGRSRPAVEPSAASVGSAHRRMCMAKWSADASCREAAEDPILVTLPTRPTSEAGRTPEGGEHARRLSHGMRLS
jgi:hypothetical protein